MAILSFSFCSRILEMSTRIMVVLPFDRYDFKQHPLSYSKVQRTVILLHGLRQSGDEWLRMTNIERYAGEAGICAVLPDIHRSFCTNMAFGMKYYDYISQEIPEMLESFLKVPLDPDHLYIGGLSAGGFGAMKCALQRPNRFRGVLCYSAGFYMLERPETLNAYPPNELIGLLGTDLKMRPEDDLEQAARQAAQSKKLPYIYLSCGETEARSPDNRRMAAFLQSCGFDVRLEQWLARHDWANWDTALQKSFQYVIKKENDHSANQ